jgi:hypothetical protein
MVSRVSRVSMIRYSLVKIHRTEILLGSMGWEIQSRVAIMRCALALHG